jgi:uncharacterized protein YeaO (DUF488 family)
MIQRSGGNSVDVIGHKGDLIELLRSKSESETMTLVYAARDEEHNGALVLKEFLEAH